MSADSKRQIIVIVDDSQVSLEAGKNILKDHYKVFTVVSGEKLFELLDNVRPDLILLDVQMPGMNGYEVIKRLKANERDKEIPVIFLTSLHDTENELEGLNLGAIDYFLKPFSAVLLLKRIENHLEREKMNKELRCAIEQANAAADAKSKFLARMSHEIRTPLNAVIGMSSLMRVDNLDETQKEYLADIKDMSGSLLNLINEILDMSKIEAGKMDIVPVHFRLEETYMHLCSAYGNLAKNNDLEFRSFYDPRLPPAVYGDETRIRQIVNNILGNALKYTRQGFIELRIEKADRDGGEWLAITVKDSGIGIKKEDINRLFSVFQQLDQEKNRNIQGTGLGLAITMRFAQMMGGTIEFDSEYGKGSCFIIYLPLVSGDREKAEKESHFERITAKENIPVLVVDDNAVNLTVALGFLKTHNIDADRAVCGADAIRMIKEKEGGYDLIFMDHMMPEMDGIEAANLIREWEREQGKIKPTPIIALTANAIAGVKEMFINAGLDDFIAKPITADEMNRVLGQWLSPEKISIGKTDNQNSANPFNDALLKELSKIDGLNLNAGLSYIGGNCDSFFLALRQFAGGCDSYINDLTAAVKANESAESENWSGYYIRVHALKGVLAAFGMEKLSNWAARLEKAAKGSGEYPPQLCKDETASFCAALSAFRDSLCNTSLFSGSDSGGEKKEKPQGDKDFFTKQIDLLQEACRQCSDEAEKIALSLLEYYWDDETDRVLEKIYRLTVSYDYEEALLAMEGLWLIKAKEK